MIAGFHGKSMFGFTRHCWTVLQSGCIILHSHQRWMSVPVALHPHQYFMFSVFHIWAIPTGVQWYLVFIFSFLRTFVAECLFIYVFTICISLVRYPLGLSPILKSSCLFFLLLNIKSSLYILDNNFLSDILLQVFSPSLWLVFSFSLYCLLQSRSF